MSSYEDICRILCQKVGVELYMQDMRVVTSLMILVLGGDILTRQSCRVMNIYAGFARCADHFGTWKGI